MYREDYFTYREKYDLHEGDVVSHFSSAWNLALVSSDAVGMVYIRRAEKGVTGFYSMQTGNLIMADQFESVEIRQSLYEWSKDSKVPLHHFYFFEVVKEGKHGVYSIRGKRLIPEKYQGGIYHKNGCFVVRSFKGAYGAYSTEGKKILKTQFDEVRPEEGFVAGKIENEYWLMQYDGQPVLSYAVNGYTTYKDYVIVQKDDEYGVYRKDGTEILPLQFDKINVWEEDSIFFMAQKGKYKMIFSHTGKALTPSDKFVKIFRRGIKLFAVEEDGTEKSFWLQKDGLLSSVH